ncbi:MAG: ABC transporter ATP-binding protein [Candidatus Humimicrobiaceae bacterium]
MDTVIKVENLSKKYIISHQQQRHNTLRDLISETSKRFVKNIIRPSEKKILSPKFEEFWALKDISFSVENGERIGIIGKNGAGKSTLLKILSRITEPTEGKVTISGRVSSLLEVGTGFHPELTGRENIYLNGAVLGMSRNDINRKFNDIVEFAEVDKFIDTPVKRYSSGMYVRLAFAVAANLDPEIMIIDEVLAVGDAQFQKKCLGNMEAVSKNEGRTILFVSHNMGAISSLTEKCLLLNNGKIVSFGPTEKIVNMYLNISENESINSNNGNFDFSEVERSKEKINLSTAKVLFTGGKICGCEYNSKNTFRESEKMIFILNLKVIKTIDFLELTLVVKNMLDVPVFSVLSNIMQINLKPGEYQTEIEIDPNYLRPGDYKLGVSLYAPDLQDGVKNAMQFAIESSPESYNNPHWAFPFLGMVKLPYCWKDVKKVN